MTAETPTPAESADRELTPAELRDALLKLKETHCTALNRELGIVMTFPEGSKIGDTDVSGQSVEEVINAMLPTLETYEPPVIRKSADETEAETNTPSLPAFLKNHESLLWKGATENPVWNVETKQYGNDVTFSYVRRNRILRPGKTAAEQGRKLEPINNTLSIHEWKVIKIVLDEYAEIEKQSGGTDDVSQRARKQIAEVLREENAFRHGRGTTPTIIQKHVTAAIEKVAGTTRGFKKESVDAETLTQRTAEILSQMFILNRARGDGLERVPRVKEDIKEIPSFAQNLNNLAECLDTQLQSGSGKGKGLTLMIGEAGTGKNEAAEYLAAVTKRPYFWFPCGRGMEAAEMVTHYEFDAKEGTQRFLTALAEGIQTPGAIVNIDEVNALKPEVQAILHGLGDGNRALNFDGIYIPVAENVLIIISGNPATYGSAGNIGQALLSRTRGQSMVMEYPALRKGELQARKEGWSADMLQQQENIDNTLRDYACDEVLILYPMLNEFSGLTDQEFALLWDCVINEQTQGVLRSQLEANPKLKALTEEPAAEHIRKTLVDLRNILEITNEWRKNYEKRQGGFDLIGVSMRDTIAVVRRYKEVRDVRTAFLSIYDDFRKNPIDGTQSVYPALEQLIVDKIGAAPPITAA